jgi:hypothetical protein
MWIINVASVLLLLSVPAVLWAIPRTRRAVGSWTLAWKTVPVGCLGFVVLLSLFGWLFKQIGVAASWGTFILALFASWAGIVAVVRLIRRKFAASGNFSWFPSVAVFLAYGVVFTMVIWVLAGVLLMRGDYRGTWREYPFCSDPPLVFGECSIHPFLAEYDYRIRFGNCGDAPTAPLMTNTGGRTYFNIYRLRDGRFYLTDKDFDYLVDPASQKVSYLDAFEGRIYAAPLPNRKITSWSGLFRNGENVVQTFNDLTVEAQNVNTAFEGMVYHGCIACGRFISAAEHSEAPIERHMRPSLQITRVSP